MNSATPITDVFRDQCATHAILVRNGAEEKHEAVDSLQADAVGYGLVEELGQDWVQQTIAEAFQDQINDDAPPQPTNGYDDGIDEAFERAERAVERERAEAEHKNKPDNIRLTAVAVPLGEWDAGDDPGPIPPRQWLLGNQFCCRFISSIVAAGGVGKSALRLLQFISLALGRSLCGQHVFRRCRVLLISLEDDHDELQRRIAAALRHYGIDRAELKGWLFCATPKGVKLAQLSGRTQIVGPLEQQLRDAIARLEPAIVSLDPFIKTHGLDENKSVDMDFVCDLLAAFAIEFGIAVDSPHHVHKGTLSPGDADSGRGSSGIRDAGRLVYTLAPMTEDEASTHGIAAEDRGAYIRLDRAKVNLIGRAGKPEWFQLIGVPIDNATTEYPAGDTIQVVVPWAPTSPWADISDETVKTVLDDIERGLLDEQGKPNGQRYSNAPKAVDRAVWPVVQKHCPNKTEAQCRTIIHKWLEIGLLVSEDYVDPIQRRPRRGLRVKASLRQSVTS
jgi:hypothetical protein